MSTATAAAPAAAVNPLAKAWKAVPFFRSSNLNQTIAFYTEILGFDIPASNSCTAVALQCGHPSHRRSVLLYFHLDPGDEEAARGQARIYLGRKDDVDTLFKQLRAKTVARYEDKYPDGAAADDCTRCVSTPISDAHFCSTTVWDLDGNRIDFVAILEDEAYRGVRDLNSGNYPEMDEPPEDGSMSSEEYDRELEAMT